MNEATLEALRKAVERRDKIAPYSESETYSQLAGHIRYEEVQTYLLLKIPDRLEILMKVLERE